MPKAERLHFFLVCYSMVWLLCMFRVAVGCCFTQWHSQQPTSFSASDGC